MKMRVKEFSELTGVSVRTLHYYDEIGLLRPAYVDKHTGYRFYDRESLLRMQEILFYRELDFSLKSICEILSDPKYDKENALAEQKQLLILKKERLERLISVIESAAKGEIVVRVFDNGEFETYREEAKEKWGKTDAYREHSEKTKNYSKDKWQSAIDGLDDIFAEFAICMRAGEAVCSNAAQTLVEKLQQYITENYYTCTKEILAGLGQMYVCDERFANNINKHGEGTAAFVSEAIKIYSRK